MGDPAGTVRLIYEAFGRGDIAAVIDFLDEDVAWEAWDDNRAQLAQVPWMAPRRGKSGAAEFFTVAGQMQMHEFRVLSMMSGGNQVAVEVLLDATMPSGRRVRDEEMHLWTLNAAGKVVRMRHYLDTAKHIAAAG